MVSARLAYVVQQVLRESQWRITEINWKPSSSTAFHTSHLLPNKICKMFEFLDKIPCVDVGKAMLGHRHYSFTPVLLLLTSQMVQKDTEENMRQTNTWSSTYRKPLTTSSNCIWTLKLLIHSPQEAAWPYQSWQLSLFSEPPSNIWPYTKDIGTNCKFDPYLQFF